MWNGSIWGGLPVKTATFLWNANLGVMPAGNTNSISTNKTDQQIVPLAVYVERNGLPQGPQAIVNVNLYRNTATGLFHLVVGNPSSAAQDMTGVALVLAYLDLQ